MDSIFLSKIKAFVAAKFEQAAEFFYLTNYVGYERLQNELSRMVLCLFASIILDFQFLYL